MDAVLSAVRDGFGHPVGGDGDDGEVDPFTDLTEGAVGGHAVDGGLIGGERPVHGIGAAGESSTQEVAQDRSADAAGVRPAPMTATEPGASRR